MTVAPGVRALVARLRAFAAVQHELTERRLLLERPWEEDLLHWNCRQDEDGEVWRLHGTLPPPPDGRRRSTTPDGWCLGSVPRPRPSQGGDR